MQHNRFDRDVWAFKRDFVGALAKWLVMQSPYPVPNKLEKILMEFNRRLDNYAKFDTAGMALINLRTVAQDMEKILNDMPDVVALNEPHNPSDKQFFFTDRYSADRHPDDDFIDITAVGQNIAVEFAQREDAECWLDRMKGGENG
jgi:hypothetical protein